MVLQSIVLRSSGGLPHFEYQAEEHVQYRTQTATEKNTTTGVHGLEYGHQIQVIVRFKHISFHIKFSCCTRGPRTSKVKMEDEHMNMKHALVQDTRELLVKAYMYEVLARSS